MCLILAHFFNLIISWLPRIDHLAPSSQLKGFMLMSHEYSTLVLQARIHIKFLISVSSSSSAAEKVSSLGKDWHKFCLKCERCSKTLNPGGHAEVRTAEFI